MKHTPYFIVNKDGSSRRIEDVYPEGRWYFVEFFNMTTDAGYKFWAKNGREAVLVFHQFGSTPNIKQLQRYITEIEGYEKSLFDNLAIFTIDYIEHRTAQNLINDRE